MSSPKEKRGKHAINQYQRKPTPGHEKASLAASSRQAAVGTPALAHAVWSCSRGPQSVTLLGSLKDAGLIALPLAPQGKDDPTPHVSQGAHGDAVAFALGTL